MRTACEQVVAWENSIVKGQGVRTCEEVGVRCFPDDAVRFGMDSMIVCVEGQKDGRADR